MDAAATLSVLNMTTEWCCSNKKCSFSLRKEKDRHGEYNWYFKCADDVEPTSGRRLHLYVDLEDDIKEAWDALYGDKLPPLAACDDDAHRDPGVLLLQAHNASSICGYWFDEEEGYGPIRIETWCTFVPTWSSEMFWTAFASQSARCA